MKRIQRINDAGEVWCSRCQAYLSPELVGRNASRPSSYDSYCKECAVVIVRRNRVARAKAALTQPPPPPKPTAHPARPVDASEGRELAATLHRQGICAGLVRGWIASVAKDADGWVTPQFATPGQARLWDALMDARLERTERRAA